MKTISVLGMSCLLLLALTSVSAAGEDPKVAAEVIALTKTQWAAEIAGKSVTDQMSLAAEDYTELNGQLSVRVESKAIAVRFSEAELKDGEKPLASEMANAK